MSPADLSPSVLNPVASSPWTTQQARQLDPQQKGPMDRNDLQAVLTKTVTPTAETAPQGTQLLQPVAGQTQQDDLLKGMNLASTYGPAARMQPPPRKGTAVDTSA